MVVNKPREKEETIFCLLFSWLFATIIHSTIKKRRRKGMTDRNLVGLFKDLKGQEWIVSHTDLGNSFPNGS